MGGLPAWIEFADPEVQRIVVDRWGDGIGITQEQVEAVTNIGDNTNYIFSNNELIETFDEFEYFTGVTSIKGDWNATLKDYSGAFANCSNLRTIKFPSSLRIINTYAFYNCKSLSVDITKMLQDITLVGIYAFSSCPVAGDLIAPNCTSIGRMAFSSTAINRILDLGLIKTILGGNSSPFYNCHQLTMVTLPASLTQMEGGALFYNDNITTIVCLATTPPTITNWTFKNATIVAYYVPDDSVEAYKAATNWSAYASKIKPISQLATDNPTLYEEVKDYLIVES